MGGVDKPLRALCGESMLGHVLRRLDHPRADTLLSVNSEMHLYLRFGAILVSDAVADLPGPLGGILAGLEWLAVNRPDAGLLVATADTPFLPADLLVRLEEARTSGRAELACAASGGRLHPAASLWRPRHADAVRLALASGERRLGRVVQGIGVAVAQFGVEPIDPFFNVNTPEDLAQARDLYGKQGQASALESPDLREAGPGGPPPGGA